MRFELPQLFYNSGKFRLKSHDSNQCQRFTSHHFCHIITLGQRDDSSIHNRSQQEALMDNSSKSEPQFTDNLLSALASYQQGQPAQVAPDKSEAVQLAPLHTRVQKKLDAIPRSVQNYGLSLLELQIQMKGRKGGKPHVGELAAALRKLGWKRRRHWSDSENGFRAKWYPSEPIAQT